MAGLALARHTKAAPVAWTRAVVERYYVPLVLLGLIACVVIGAAVFGWLGEVQAWGDAR